QVVLDRVDELLAERLRVGLLREHPGHAQEGRPGAPRVPAPGGAGEQRHGVRHRDPGEALQRGRRRPARRAHATRRLAASCLTATSASWTRATVASAAPATVSAVTSARQAMVGPPPSTNQASSPNIVTATAVATTTMATNSGASPAPSIRRSLPRR